MLQAAVANDKISSTGFSPSITDRQTCKTHICDNFIAGFDNKYAVIGFDRAGNLLEVMYNRIDDKMVKVFHAMRCCQYFISNLDIV
jgi:hypothetical protein